MAEQDEVNNSAEQFSSKMEDLSTSFKYINRNMSEMGDKLESSYGAMHQMNQAARDLGDSLKSNKDVMDKVVQGELSYSEVKKLQKQSQERINKLNEKREHLAKKLSTMGSEADRQKKQAIIGGVAQGAMGALGLTKAGGGAGLFTNSLKPLNS